MSDFIKSVDDLIAKDFMFEAMRELHDARACDIKDWAATERILKQLIRMSIAHARRQEAGRKTGAPSFDQAIRALRTSQYGVTRSSWSIFQTIRRDHPFDRSRTVSQFPAGCEELPGQIFNLGVESHDDLLESP